MESKGSLVRIPMKPCIFILIFYFLDSFELYIKNKGIYNVLTAKYIDEIFLSEIYFLIYHNSLADNSCN